MSRSDPRGSVGTMVIRLFVLLCLPLLCSPGFSADCRTEPAVRHPSGLFSCSVTKSLVCEFLSKLVLMKEGKPDAKILPALEW